VPSLSATLALACLGVHSAEALNNYWTGANGNSWHDVANWRFMGTITPIPRVPSDGDVAVVNQPLGAPDVVLNGNTAPINGLQVLTSGVVNTNGHLLQVDDGGAALTTVMGNADFSAIEVVPRVGGGVAFQTDNLELITAGYLFLAGGDAVIEGTTTITTAPLFQSSSAPFSHIHFGGDVTMSQGFISVDDATFGPGVDVYATNDARITLRHNFGVNNGQTFEFDTGAVFQTHSLSVGNGSNGTLRADGLDSKIDLQALLPTASLTIGHPASGSGLVELTDSAVMETGTGAIQVLKTGQLNVAGGTFNGHGHVTVNGGTINHTGGEFRLDAGRNLTVVNDGQVTLEGVRFIDGNAVYHVNTGGDLTINSLFGIGWNAGAGTLTVDGPGSTLTVNSTLQLGSGDNQTDRVTIRNGSHASINTVAIVLGSGPGETYNGEVRVESGSTMDVSSFVGVGNGPLAPGGTAELHVIGGGTVTHTNDNLTSFDEHTRIGSDGGVWGTIFVGRGGSYASSIGDIDIRPRGKLDLFGDASGPGTFHAHGHIDLKGEIDIHRQGPASNPGGILNVNNGLEINGGTVYLNDGEINADEIVINAGNFEFLGGTLSVQNFQGNLVQEGGTLAPGNSAGGTTIDGDYSLQSGATLAIDVGGLIPAAEHDFVDVTGSALIQGELQLAMIDGFVPQATDSFTILSSPSFSGAFSNVASGARLTTSDGLGSFLVDYAPAGGAATDVVLSDFIAANTADFDLDGDVDGNDFTTWRQAFGINGKADADRDGDSDGFDFLTWQQQFDASVAALATSQAVPEPSSMLIAALLAAISCVRRAIQ